MPVVGDLLDLEDRDRMGPDERVQPLAQAVRRQRLRDVDMRGHGQRMDAGVGAAGGVDRCLLAGHPLQRFLERLLDRRAMVLPLPAHERPAVIFDRQAPAGHGRIVPFGIGKPRSSSSGVIGAAPGALDLEWADGALSRRRSSVGSSSTSPGRPDASLPAAASSSLIRSPLTSNQAPGDGSEGADLAFDLARRLPPVDPRLRLVDLGRVGRAGDRLRLGRRLGDRASRAAGCAPDLPVLP